jgi:hypothetical protein
VKKLLVAAALAASVSTASAFDNNPSPENSPMNRACLTLEIGFLKAAPCLSKYMMRMGGEIHAQLAADIDALADNVRAGNISEKRAYRLYEEARRRHNERAIASAGAGRAVIIGGGGFDPAGELARSLSNQQLMSTYCFNSRRC